jgi:hypothetical protein
VLELKICDFTGETFKGFEVLWVLSSGEFIKLRYETIPVKSASGRLYFRNLGVDVWIIYRLECGCVN